MTEQAQIQQNQSQALPPSRWQREGELLNPRLALAFSLAEKKLKKGLDAGRDCVWVTFHGIAEWFNVAALLAFALYALTIYVDRESKKHIVIENPVKIKPIKRGK